MTHTINSCRTSVSEARSVMFPTNTVIAGSLVVSAIRAWEAF